MKTITQTITFTLEVVMTILSKWNLSRISAYVVRKGLLKDGQTIEALEREYKRFITLHVLHPNLDIPMSAEVDEYWHAHMLFSMDYVQMCHALGRRYIHHKPLENEAERTMLGQAYQENTLGLYIHYWGEPDPQYWPHFAQVCNYNGDCVISQHEGNIS